MRATTGNLEQRIRNAHNIKEHLAAFFDEQIDIDLPSYLKELQGQKNLSRSDIFVRGDIVKVTGSHVLTGERHPTRDTALRFCFGLELDIDQSQRLLRIARHGELYARDKRDAVIMFCLEKKKTAVECNLLLQEENLPLLNEK